MSDFAVTAEHLQILPHPNADALELAVVGGYHAVVVKGAYKSGQYAIYIPEAAILPAPLIEELGLTGRLAGGNADRVKAIRLRGELSQGIVCLPVALAREDLLAAARVRTDFAARLGIRKYVPEVPASMSGRVEAAPDLLPWIEIENIKRYPGMFRPGEPVTASEKIHGCLQGRTRILMPDFSYRLIVELVKTGYRGEVMGVDDLGNVAPTRVVNTFDNGTTKDWVRIVIQRRGAGRGSHYGALTVTPNHRFWAPGHLAADTDGYVQADEIRAGDQVWLHRSEVTMPPLAEQVLIGKMLGDGSFRARNTASAYIAFGHIEKHRAYLEWTLAMLGPLGLKSVGETISGYGSKMVRTCTVGSSLILDLFSDWIVNGEKQVPTSAIEQIGPIALAFWYMDDGSLSHNEGQEDRAQFSTNAFNERSIDNLLIALARFGIQGTKFEAAGWRIRLDSDSSERLFLLIAPYVPTVMQYKLPERYRGGEAGFPRTFGEYKPLLRRQLVLSVERTRNADHFHPAKNPRGSHKYDLETETHNFFANGILVHNSALLLSVSVGSERLAVSSKGLGARGLGLLEDEGNLYWRAIRVHGLAAKVQALRARLGAARLGVFGEVYGLGVQDLAYGVSSRNVPGFAVFDACVADASGARRWLAQPELRLLTTAVGLPMVPQLYAGPYQYETLAALAEGPTVAGAGVHMREGLVVRPLVERFDAESGGRAIAKFVSAAYLLRKGGTEFE
jgi:hypothetical protein